MNCSLPKRNLIPCRPDWHPSLRWRVSDRGSPIIFERFFWTQVRSRTCYASDIQFDCEARNESMKSMRNKRLSLDEKLIALRETSSHGKWNSLDDQRVCAVCDRLITGRMIDAWRDVQGCFHLHCPTMGCAGTPHDWFQHGLGRSSTSRLRHSTAPVVTFALSAG